eukprot:CAMPEP_0183552292 /NCGR_PEP_ID=MMETSP0371-20130417/70952_1 /TAXON_ID=268820 /ORGANISM="Peridinium aciculiferum, Strain PAER-2" /LENGTH=30 /DNA_ID= /DNA_START= /DNA_END= /DNA_ORIENTATION=
MAVAPNQWSSTAEDSHAMLLKMSRVLVISS